MSSRRNDRLQVERHYAHPVVTEPTQGDSLPPTTGRPTTCSTHVLGPYDRRARAARVHCSASMLGLVRTGQAKLLSPHFAPIGILPTSPPSLPLITSVAVMGRYTR